MFPHWIRNVICLNYTFKLPSNFVGAGITTNFNNKHLVAQPMSPLITG